MNTAELEQHAAELRRRIQAPVTEAAELAEVEKRVAASREIDAQAVAREWLKGNARAIGSHASELNEAIERIRINPNAKDVATANEFWNKIMGRVQLAEVVVRRFPGITVPKAPTVLPPGRRGVAADGLSIAMPQRQLFPMILASDSAGLRERLYACEAHQWLVARGSSLPEDLRAVLATVVPEVDTSERIEKQRAEAQRQRSAAERAARA